MNLLGFNEERKQKWGITMEIIGKKNYLLLLLFLDLLALLLFSLGGEKTCDVNKGFVSSFKLSIGEARLHCPTVDFFYFLFSKFLTVKIHI